MRAAQVTATDVMTRLAGRVAVVTGGAGSIGSAIASELAAAGVQVVSADIAVAPSEGDSAESPVHEMAADVTDPASVRSLAATVVKRFGRLDIWVNGAGIWRGGLLTELDDGDLDLMMRVNLFGAFYGIREAARAMDRGGVIVNVESTGAFQARAPGTSVYVASKHGLRGLTRSAAVELGPRGIRVVGIAPAMVQDTAMSRQAGSSTGGTAAVSDRIPLRRLADRRDVARCVLFAVSDLASFVSGSSIAVDGGLLAT